MATKPQDFIERATSDFPIGVDVASVPQNANPKDLLFGKPPAPPTEAEPDEFFKWDGEKEVDGQKGAFYVDVENNGRMERFWGKTRTEVTKNLAEGKKNANQALADTRASERPFTPDTKLPYDPIQRKQPRQLTQAEIYQIQQIAESDPVKAQAMAFEASTGLTFEQVAQSVTISEQTRRELYAANVSSAFCARHQKDFVPNQANMTLMDSWLKERQLPVTENNLEGAFRDLSKAEKLAKPAEIVPRETVQEFTPPQPPVSPPSRPALVNDAPRGGLSREQAATIQTGSLADARSVIQDVFRQGRGSR